jgi:DNA-directed RNA polymerase subunit beta
MKFNRRIGRDELTGAMTLSTEDIAAVIVPWLSWCNGRGRNR